MKSYTLTIPNVHGVLSDDFLFFEGVSKPDNIGIIRDSKDITDDNIVLLERYFNDIYNLFLRKFSSFAMFENVVDEDTIKLQALLQELIKVKNIIVNSKTVKDYDLL